MLLHYLSVIHLVFLAPARCGSDANSSAVEKCYFHLEHIIFIQYHDIKRITIEMKCEVVPWILIQFGSNLRCHMTLLGYNV